MSRRITIPSRSELLPQQGSVSVRIRPRSRERSFLLLHANMIRRHPTTIQLTAEDIIRYDEAYKQKMAQQQAEQQARNQQAQEQERKPRTRTAADRVMGER